jgi:hypothetical protein
MMLTIRRYFLAFAVISIVGAANPITSAAQGCTDPSANNYNAAATVNDGSCTYSQTSYSPVVKFNPLTDTLIETSGLQMAGGSLWSFNDGGGKAEIYRIDTVRNFISQVVSLTGATNVDWEDIAFDGTYFYIGDFGNNAKGSRGDLKIYKFPLSAITAPTVSQTVTIPANQIEVLNFSYSNQPLPLVDTPANTTRFDCEAMIVDDNNIHLFSKNWAQLTTTHYVIPSTLAGTYVALALETLQTNYLVTAADKAVGKKLVALLGYQTTGSGNHFMHLLSDYSGGLYFNGNKKRIDLPNASVMGQAEGLTFVDGTYGYISNEKLVQTFGTFTITVTPKLQTFNISNIAPAAVLPIDLNDFRVENNNGVHRASWQFSTSVNALQLQYSTNGIDFTTLKSYTSSLQDAFTNSARGAATICYRLAWQKNSGAHQYSNIFCLNNREKMQMRNISLTSPGQLAFILDGNSSRNYSFLLVTSDGKVLSQASNRAYSPGSNKINFANNLLTKGSVVFLVTTSNEGKETRVIKVE